MSLKTVNCALKYVYMNALTRTLHACRCHALFLARGFLQAMLPRCLFPFPLPLELALALALADCECACVSHLYCAEPRLYVEDWSTRTLNIILIYTLKHFLHYAIRNIFKKHLFIVLFLFLNLQF